MKQKKNTWHQNGKESSKRPHNGRKCGHGRQTRSEASSWKLKKDEEDEARCLKRCHATLTLPRRSCEAEWKLYTVLCDYIEAFEKERGRPKIIRPCSAETPRI